MGSIAELEALADDAVRAIRRKCVQSGDNFTEASCRVLTEHELTSAIDSTGFPALLVESEQSLSNAQVPTDFSDLHIILHASEDVQVQLLFWQTATTSIHNHEFDGAFRVLAGESIHTRYEFVRRIPNVDAFSVGRLGMLHGEIIVEGDVRPIEAGNTIHAVYHLGRPSVTLLVLADRTRADSATYEYRGGALEVDSSRLELLQVRQIQALRLVAQHDRARFRDLLMTALGRASPKALYWTLRGLDREISRLDPADIAALEHLLSRDETTARVAWALRREKVVGRLVNMRAKLTEPSAQIILAMLANVPDPSYWPALLRTLRERGCFENANLPRALDEIFADPFWRLFGGEDEVGRLRADLLDVVSGLCGGDDAAPASVSGIKRSPVAEITTGFVHAEFDEETMAA